MTNSIAETICFWVDTNQNQGHYTRHVISLSVMRAPFSAYNVIKIFSDSNEYNIEGKDMVLY